MVDRTVLTAEFVNSTKPPASGERWIADTKLIGFGLRLWATKSGGQKAFAIRTVDHSNKSIRKTFDKTKGWTTALRFAYPHRRLPKYGDYIDDAREWARDEIDRQKGRTTLPDDELRRYQQAQIYVREMTLAAAAKNLIGGMQLNGLSQAYIDRIDKLFANNVPPELRNTPLHKLSPAAMGDVLANANAAAGSVGILRSFIGQIFVRASSFDGRLLEFSEQMSAQFLSTWRKNRHVRFPELNKLSDDIYQQIFRHLESETRYWQQSHAIRLFFEFHAPLTRVLAAEWRQIIDEHWYPYYPIEKKYWFECRDNLSASAQSVLDRIAILSKRDFGATPYWFPSRFAGRAHSHR